MEERRLKHINNVAKAMFVLASEYYTYNEQKSKEMWLLGYLHDIGYDLTEDPRKHGLVGGELLKTQGYPYWEEVVWHGKCTSPYFSEEWFLLNIADLSIDGYGNPCTQEGRLADMRKRYGTDAAQAEKMFKLLKILKHCALAHKQTHPHIWDLWQDYANGTLKSLLNQRIPVNLCENTISSAKT